MGSYWFADMGTVNEGKFIDVTLNVAANVRLMNRENFLLYKNKQSHEFFGGYVKFTPYTIKLPRTDHWYVVVDLGGHTGTISSSATVYQTARKNKVKILA